MGNVTWKWYIHNVKDPNEITAALKQGSSNLRYENIIKTAVNLRSGGGVYEYQGSKFKGEHEMFWINPAAYAANNNLSVRILLENSLRSSYHTVLDLEHDFIHADKRDIEWLLRFIVANTEPQKSWSRSLGPKRVFITFVPGQFKVLRFVRDLINAHARSYGSNARSEDLFVLSGQYYSALVPRKASTLSNRFRPITAQEAAHSIVTKQCETLGLPEPKSCDLNLYGLDHPQWDTPVDKNYVSLTEWQIHNLEEAYKAALSLGITNFHMFDYGSLSARFKTPGDLGFKAIERLSTLHNQKKNHDGADGRVASLQKYLVQNGYELPKFGVDGMYGEETQNAVISFLVDNFNDPTLFLEIVQQEQSIEAVEMALELISSPYSWDTR